MIRGGRKRDRGGVRRVCLSPQTALEEQNEKKKKKKKKNERVVIQGAYLFGDSREEDPETEHDDLIPVDLVRHLCPPPP